jgi:hypothetical protein
VRRVILGLALILGGSAASGWSALAAIPSTFTTAQRIEAASHGAVGDGKTDNTQAFRTLLGAGNRTIHLTAGDYVTGKLAIPSNTILLLDRGVILRDSGKLGINDPFISILSRNVYIAGAGARVVADRDTYTTGEQRHGLFIFGAANVVIDGLESSAQGGDGFYIGGPPHQPAQDITLRNCIASNNRRQGLSITSARRVEVIDCRFDHTNGTAPQCGIDLEPNEPIDFMDEIHIVRPYTAANRGGGIAIVLQKLDASSHRPGIFIVDHRSVGERKSLIKVGTEDVPAATIQYSAAPGS